MNLKNFPKKLDSKTTYLRITVPENLDVALEGLIRKVLREQPKNDDIYSFAANYFETLLKIRDKAGIKYTPDQICPFHNDEDAHEMIKLANTFPKPFHETQNFSDKNIKNSENLAPSEIKINEKKEANKSVKGTKKTTVAKALPKTKGPVQKTKTKEKTPNLIGKLPVNVNNQAKKDETRTPNNEEGKQNQNDNLVNVEEKLESPAEEEIEFIKSDPIKQLVEKELMSEQNDKNQQDVPNDVVEGENVTNKTTHKEVNETELPNEQKSDEKEIKSNEINGDEICAVIDKLSVPSEVVDKREAEIQDKSEDDNEVTDNIKSVQEKIEDAENVNKNEPGGTIENAEEYLKSGKTEEPAQKILEDAKELVGKTNDENTDETPQIEATRERTKEKSELSESLDKTNKEAEEKEGSIENKTKEQELLDETNKENAYEGVEIEKAEEEIEQKKEQVIETKETASETQEEPKLNGDINKDVTDAEEINRTPEIVPQEIQAEKTQNIENQRAISDSIGDEKMEEKESTTQADELEVGVQKTEPSIDSTEVRQDQKVADENNRKEETTLVERQLNQINLNEETKLSKETPPADKETQEGIESEVENKSQPVTEEKLLTSSMAEPKEKEIETENETKNEEVSSASNRLENDTIIDESPNKVVGNIENEKPEHTKEVDNIKTESSDKTENVRMETDKKNQEEDKGSEELLKETTNETERVPEETKELGKKFENLGENKTIESGPSERSFEKVDKNATEEHDENKKPDDEKQEVMSGQTEVEAKTTEKVAERTNNESLKSEEKAEENKNEDGSKADESLTVNQEGKLVPENNERDVENSAKTITTTDGSLPLTQGVGERKKSNDESAIAEENSETIPSSKLKPEQDTAGEKGSDVKHSEDDKTNEGKKDSKENHTFPKVEESDEKTKQLSEPRNEEKDVIDKSEKTKEEKEDAKIEEDVTAITPKKEGSEEKIGEIEIPKGIAVMDLTTVIEENISAERKPEAVESIQFEEKGILITDVTTQIYEEVIIKPETVSGEVDKINKVGEESAPDNKAESDATKTSENEKQLELGKDENKIEQKAKDEGKVETEMNGLKIEDDKQDQNIENTDELCMVVDKDNIIKVEEPEAEDKSNQEEIPKESKQVKTIKTHYYDFLQVPEPITREYKVHHTKEDGPTKGPLTEMNGSLIRSYQMLQDRANGNKEPMETIDEVTTSVPPIHEIAEDHESDTPKSEEDILKDLMTPSSDYSLNVSELSYMTVNEMFLDSEKQYSSREKEELRFKTPDRTEESTEKTKEEEIGREVVEEVITKTIIPSRVEAVPVPPREAEEINQETSEELGNIKDKIKDTTSKDSSSSESNEPTNDTSSSKNGKSIDSDTPIISVEVKTVIETQILDDDDDVDEEKSSHLKYQRQLEDSTNVEIQVETTINVDGENDRIEETKSLEAITGTEIEGKKEKHEDSDLLKKETHHFDQSAEDRNDQIKRERDENITLTEIVPTAGKDSLAESDSTTSSAATEIKRFDSNATNYRRSSTQNLLTTQSLGDTKQRSPLLKTRSLSSFRQGVTDFEVWNTIEKELERAATTIQSKFRGYTTRKKLRREDAVQITTEESSVSTTPTEQEPRDDRQLSTGEFHDSIVLSAHPR